MSREMYNYNGEIVVNAINNAKTISEISWIMRDARLSMEV